MMKKELYIIHGWTYSTEPWTSVVSILRSKGVTVHQLRVPGLTNESDAVWDIEGYVQWLHDELQGVGGRSCWVIQMVVVSRYIT